MRHRDIARRALLQEKVGCLDDRLGMEPCPHPPVQERVGDGDHSHALVVRHEGTIATSFPRAGARRVVERLVEAVAPERARGCEPGEIARRGARIDHRRECRRVRRDDGVLAQPALQAQARDAEVRILVGELEVAHVVGRLRDAPGHVELGAVGDLPAHDQAAGLLEEAPGRRAHDERGHQVLEHRSRPGDERRAVAERGDGAPEPEPVPRRDVALGDRHEAREARLRGEQIVAARIELAFGDAIANG